MKVLKVSLNKPVLIGTRPHDFFHEGSELARLYSATYDNSLRMVKFVPRKEIPGRSLYVPLENVTSLELSEEMKPETPAQSSGNGRSKK